MITIRMITILMMIISYFNNRVKPSVPVNWIQRQLGFRTLSACLKYLQQHNAVLNDNRSELDTKNSIAVE